MQATSPMSSHPSMHPHQLDFTNPQPYSPMSTPQSTGTPMALTPTCSDASPHSSESSSLTPSLSSLALRRGCGHPHKQILPPPPVMMITLTELAKLNFRDILNVKKTEMWRFQKLMSGEGSEY